MRLCGCFMKVFIKNKSKSDVNKVMWLTNERWTKENIPTCIRSFTFKQIYLSNLSLCM